VTVPYFLYFTDVAQQRLASTPAAACTAACTSKGQNANAGALDADQGGQSEGTDPADPLAALASAIANLSPADRARLVGMLAAPGRT
jgi:hypothetical protein